MRIKVNFEVPVPTFGIPGLLRAVKRRLPKGNRDSIVRNIFEEPLRFDCADRIEFETPLDAPNVDIQHEVHQAVESFKRRNQVDCPIAVVGSAQGTLLRSLTLPPVERRKIPVIMAYEAEQMIPFALEDVEWRYIDIGGDEDEGYALEWEYLLIARKAQQVRGELAPFVEVGLKRRVDLIQTEQLTLGDYLWNFHIVPHGDLPPRRDEIVRYIVGIDMGTSGTNLVVTSGRKLWSRDIPIGGSHFTREISKKLRIPCAKAEQLKLSFNSADEEVAKCLDGPAADFVGEVARTLSFFLASTKNAELSGIAFFGGGFKLPGLKEKVLNEVSLSEIEIPFGHGLTESSTLNRELVREHGASMSNALTVAMQRLGIGKYRINLYPDGTTFGLKSRSAWGIDIGKKALTAVRLSRRLAAA